MSTKTLVILASSLEATQIELDIRVRRMRFIYFIIILYQLRIIMN